MGGREGLGDQFGSRLFDRRQKRPFRRLGNNHKAGTRLTQKTQLRRSLLSVADDHDTPPLNLMKGREHGKLASVTRRIVCIRHPVHAHRLRHCVEPSKGIRA